MKKTLIALLVSVPIASAVAADDPFRSLALATRYEIGDGSEMRIVSERIVEGAGVDEHVFLLSHGSVPERAVATDRASGAVLSSTATGEALRIALGMTLGERACATMVAKIATGEIEEVYVKPRKGQRDTSKPERQPKTAPEPSRDSSR